MAGIKTENTMVEGLQSLVQELALLKMTPDADLPWIIGIETQVLQKIREPMAQQGPGGQMGQGPVPSMAGGGPGMPGMPPAGGPMPGSPLAGRAMVNQPGGMGGAMSPGGPPTDEIARLLS